MGRRSALVLVGLIAAGLVALTVPAPSGPPQDRALAAGAAGDGPLAITVLGTSLSRRAIWPDIFARRLGECLGREVGVTRIARAGANSRWGLTQAPGVAADLVVIEFALADADLVDGVWPGVSRGNHRAIVAAIRDKRPEARIVLMTTNPVGGLQRLKRAALGIYYEGYRALAGELGIGLLDAWPRWPGTEAIADGVHPDPEAEARIVVRPLLSLVAPGFGADCAGP